MAWGIIAAPGTEYGPCEGECDHTDCALDRQDAAMICGHCGEPIGYETKYVRARYFDMLNDGWKYYHYICELNAIKEGR